MVLPLPREQSRAQQYGRRDADQVGAAEEQHHGHPVEVGGVFVLVGDAAEDALEHLDLDVAEQGRLLQVVVDVRPPQDHRDGQQFQDDQIGERHVADLAPGFRRDHGESPDDSDVDESAAGAAWSLSSS